jgi:hypothetical protein
LEQNKGGIIMANPMRPEPQGNEVKAEQIPPKVETLKVPLKEAAKKK